MIRSQKFKTLPSIESLESRLLMAGDVTAHAIELTGGGDSVVIAGDNEANQIRVIEVDANHIRVEGLEGTTINGKAADDIFASDILLVDIDLGNGSDSLVHEFSGEQRPHATRISTGTGNDALTVLARGRLGLLDIDTGTGRDKVLVELGPAALLDGGLRIDTGVGNDNVILIASDESLPMLNGLINRIETAEGNDRVRFEGDFGIASSLSVNLGVGDDTLIGDSDTSNVQRISVVGGPGKDTVLNDSYFLSLALFEVIGEDDE